MQNGLMTGQDDHPTLRAAWLSLGAHLDQIPRSLSYGDVQPLEVGEKAERVRDLGSHLEGAVALLDRHLYAPAFSVARTSLEHLAVDWLLFLGRTYTQRVRNVSADTWGQWLADREDGAAWTQGIVEWSRSKAGHVRIVREGLFSEPDESGRREQLSIYYFLLQRYVSWMGPVDDQPDDGLVDSESLREHAQENRDTWQQYLTWAALIDGLQDNRLMEPVDTGRLSVHYRFLSGYTHPVANHQRETYGRDLVSDWPRYDHFASELLLLYVVSFASLELRNFLKAVEPRPDVQISEATAILRDIEQADIAIAHFWFLGTNPHSYDLFTARNTEAFRALRDAKGGTLPNTPKAEEISYPRNPLKRLVAMHASGRELITGLTYISPWPRDDARRR